jgi:hypothetical protein
MVRAALRFARLLRRYCARLQIVHAARQSQRPDLHKRATLGAAPDHEHSPDWVDLHADPSIIGTTWL